MAQQWVALIYLGPSGIEMPCTVLPTLPFCQQTPLYLVADCQVKRATCARSHTEHSWLAPGGLVWLLQARRKGSAACLMHWLFVMVLDEKCVKQQKNWYIKDVLPMWFLFICYSIQNHGLITHTATLKGHLWCWGSTESLWVLCMHWDFHCTHTDLNDI